MPPGPSGGIGVVVYSLAKTLSEDGYDVTVLLLNCSVEHYQEAPFRIQFIGNPYFKGKSIFTPLTHLLLHFNLSLNSRFDIIEFPDFNFYSAFYFLSTPHVIRIHDSLWYHRGKYFGAGLNRPFKMLKWYLQKRAIEKASCRIYVSNYCRKRTEKLLATNNLPSAVVPNCVDEISEKYSSSPENVFIYHGTLNEHKNTDILAKIMKKGAFDYNLKVIGRENYRGEEFPSDTVFTGALPHNEVSKHLATGYLYLFPSLNESFSLSVAEAILHGMAIIGPRYLCDIGLLIDGVNGFAVDNLKDVDEWIMKINKYLTLTDENKAAMRQRSREISTQFSDLNAFIRANYNIYEEYSISS